MALVATIDEYCGTQPSVHDPRIVMVKRSLGPGVEGLKLMTVSPEAACGATVIACATGRNKRNNKEHPVSNLMFAAVAKTGAAPCALCLCGESFHHRETEG